MSTPTERPGGDSVRLIFTYEQGTVRLVSQHRVDIAVTGFDAAQHERPGDFVEVRDAAGSSLTRVPIHSGLDIYRTLDEVFGSRGRPVDSPDPAAALVGGRSRGRSARAPRSAVPRPWVRSSRPSTTNSAMACRTVVRDVSNRSASSRSVATAAPGARPAISSRISLFTR